jgi:hypothetical protein
MKKKLKYKRLLGGRWIIDNSSPKVLTLKELATNTKTLIANLQQLKIKETEK